MYLILLDTETGGLDPQNDPLIEVAAAVWDVEAGAMVDAHSWIVEAESNNAEKINRIPPRLLGDGNDRSLVIDHVKALADRFDAYAIVAHNAEFDRGFLPELSNAVWICSKDDIEWSWQSKPGQSLIALTLESGMGVSHAHRALSDVLMLVRLFDHAWQREDDIEAMIERAVRPKSKFQALVSFDERQKAKDAGFSWDPTSRRWLRHMAVDDVENLDFQVRRVEPLNG